MKSDLLSYIPVLTIISLCSSRFFKKFENSRKEASGRRKESGLAAQAEEGKAGLTRSYRTYAALIVGLRITDELELEVSE